VITDSSHTNLQNLEGFAELDFGFLLFGECLQIRTSVPSTYSLYDIDNVDREM
jgi:hypothetical protein